MSNRNLEHTIPPSLIVGGALPCRKLTFHLLRASTGYGPQEVLMEWKLYGCDSEVHGKILTLLLSLLIFNHSELISYQENRADNVY